MVSEYTGMIFRVKYLESVLQQDISWFEENDPQSLASKISKEATAIQIATGEKMANIFFALTMCVAGVWISFILGWKFALVWAGIMPFLSVIMTFLIWVLQLGYKAAEKAFKESSTKAEQALTSIKVVAAFGQEAKEEERFWENLEEARKTGIKFHLLTGLGYALNNGSFMFFFGTILLLGGIFVTQDVHNDVADRGYTPGDIIAIFFGIMFGAFSLSIAGPNFKSVTRGRQAAYAALETINRQPTIMIDDPSAIPLSDDMQGEIEFQNVEFSYNS
jgi:ABC-type multidrug transport system fused ATPase/permease subunit